MARVVRGVAAQPDDRRAKWKRGPGASGGCASGCTGIPAARGGGDRSGIRGRPLTDDGEPGRSAAGNGPARPVRGLASSSDCRRSAAFSQLFALGPDSAKSYRISVKVEPNGVAGPYLRDHVRVGDVLDVSAPRGSFVLQSGERPVLLLSAGIGATPVLAMLHALSATRSTRQVWWLHGAPNRKHHPFAAEVGRLMLLDRARRQPCLLQQAGAGRQDGPGFRRYRPPVAIGLRRGRCFTRGRCLPVRAGTLHGRDERDARRLGRGAEAHSRRALQRQ